MKLIKLLSLSIILILAKSLSSCNAGYRLNVKLAENGVSQRFVANFEDTIKSRVIHLTSQQAEQRVNLSIAAERNYEGELTTRAIEHTNILNQEMVRLVGMSTNFRQPTGTYINLVEAKHLNVFVEVTDGTNIGSAGRGLQTWLVYVRITLANNAPLRLNIIHDDLTFYDMALNSIVTELNRAPANLDTIPVTNTNINNAVNEALEDLSLNEDLLPQAWDQRVWQIRKLIFKTILSFNQGYDFRGYLSINQLIVTQSGNDVTITGTIKFIL